MSLGALLLLQDEQWKWLENDLAYAYRCEMDQITRVVKDNTFDGLVFGA